MTDDFDGNLKIEPDPDFHPGHIESLPPPEQKYALKYLLKISPFRLEAIRETIERIVGVLEKRGRGRPKGARMFKDRDEFLAVVRFHIRGGRNIEQRELARRIGLSTRQFRRYQIEFGFSSFPDLIRECRE